MRVSEGDLFAESYEKEYVERARAAVDRVVSRNVAVELTLQLPTANFETLKYLCYFMQARHAIL